MGKSLTKKQKEILDYVTDFLDTNGYAPSYREIARQFKLSSVATVHDHIESLVTKGYLRNVEGEVRSLEVVERQEPRSGGSEPVPLFGLIAAGQPIEALESPEKVEVPQSMLGTGEYFALQVKGVSMIEDGINDGDFVIIERRSVANNGDIVVALLNGREATLKRFYKEATRVRLEPANSTMKPIFVRDNVQIQGKVVGLMRKY
jgi:repressor LexA